MPPPIPHFRNPVHACLLDPSSSPTSACRLSRCSCVLLPLTTCYCLSPPATASHHLLLALAPSPPGPGRHAPACLLGPSPNSLVHYPPPPCPQASEARACVSAGSKFHPGASGLALILQAVHGHRSLGELTVVRLDGGRPGLLGGLPAGLLGGQARATRGAACWATRGVGQGR